MILVEIVNISSRDTVSVILTTWFSRFCFEMFFPISKRIVRDKNNNRNNRNGTADPHGIGSNTTSHTHREHSGNILFIITDRVRRVDYYIRTVNTCYSRVN